ncbi:helix-turn-helix transcriptional regulator [uncultured Veillonella sp.]|uniref:helix-turn-helix transcriptional regulator n=1 Tax=uncultured Veillonella sp. TaxID=159268 RepID=UPI00260D6101|nr:helix-turn-helix transcriptional regulator [uncultured Veillonella sp.]
MYKVKEFREKRKISQEKLAEKSGVSRATIASLEAPDSETTTTTSTLIKIATALECKVSDIFLL